MTRDYKVDLRYILPAEVLFRTQLQNCVDIILQTSPKTEIFNYTTPKCWYSGQYVNIKENKLAFAEDEKSIPTLRWYKKRSLAVTTWTAGPTPI